VAGIRVYGRVNVAQTLLSVLVRLATVEWINVVRAAPLEILRLRAGL